MKIAIGQIFQLVDDLFEIKDVERLFHRVRFSQQTKSLIN